jgi:hypothetical protein
MADTAAAQWGVITRSQLTEIGYSHDSIERMVHSGRLLQRHAGTYVLRGVPRSRRQDIIAAQLWAGPGAAISHRPAAATWDLAGVEWSIPELTTARCLRPNASVIVYRKRLSLGDVRMRDGIRLTSVPRTLLDLSAVCPRGVVEQALEDALHKRVTTVAQLQRQLDRSGGRGVRGTRLFAELIASAGTDPLAESRLERKLGRLLARLEPPAVPQFEIHDGSGLVARVDFAYSEQRVAVEGDGYRFHGARRQWKRDLERRTALARLGWRVLHFTWEDVDERPDWVLDEVTRSLCPHPR